jgi:raffinose/stachyose/melibiose transport system permease protein
MGLYRYTLKTFARELLLLAFAVGFCVPLYILTVLSLKSNADVFTQPLSVPRDPHWGNFSDAWKGTAYLSVGRALWNSVVITVGSVVLLIAVGSLAAYTIARQNSRLANGLYLLFVAGIIVPFQLGVIPLYVVMRQLSLTGNFVGIILLHGGLLMPLTVFLYTGFIRTLPREYEEAAQVDGAGLIRIYFRVVFPLLRPVTGTVAILTGLIAWNDFFLPLIFLSGSERQPLPVAIYSFAGEHFTQWNLIFAAVGISIAPMLTFYIFAQKQLMRGFAGGIRG